MRGRPGSSIVMPHSERTGGRGLMPTTPGRPPLRFFGPPPIRPTFVRPHCPPPPHYRHHSHHRTSFSFGFGFYSYCVAPPPVYPVYYPVYAPPVVVTSPVYVTQPVVVETPVYAAPQTVYYDQPGYYEQSVVTAPQQQYASPDQYVAPPQGVTLPQTPTPEAPPIAMPEPPVSEAAPAPTPLLEEPLPETPQALPAEEPQTPRLSTEELERLVMGGTTQFREGKYDEAAASFLQIINEDGDNVDAQLAYAVSRFATGDYPSSAMAIRRGVTLFPEVVNSLFDLRGNYAEQEDFVKHLRSLEQWLGEHNDDSDAALVLAFVYHFTGQREPAPSCSSRSRPRPARTTRSWRKCSLTPSRSSRLRPRPPSKARPLSPNPCRPRSRP